MAADAKRPWRGYWALVAALLGFGFLTAFTIGGALLLIGLTLAILAPLRGRPRVFWPALFLVVGFVVGFALVAPFSCSQEAFTDVERGQTVESSVVCRSLVGITYEGSENPSALPGVIAGLIFGALSAMIAWFLAGRREAPVE